VELFKHNIPIYMTDDLVKVFGYKGKLRNQKVALMKLVKKYPNIRVLQLNNAQYGKFLSR